MDGHSNYLNNSEPRAQPTVLRCTNAPVWACGISGAWMLVCYVPLALGRGLKQTSSLAPGCTAALDISRL